MKTTPLDYGIAVLAAALLACLLGLGLRDRFTPQPTPVPVPAVAEPVNYLEWRATMPPMHSTEPLKVTL